MFNSLRARFLLSSNVLLMLFFVITGCLLDQLFQHTLMDAETNRLRAQLIELTSIAESSFGVTKTVSQDVKNYRLMTPHSGLYAIMTSQDHRVIWESPSMQGQDIPFMFEGDLDKETFYSTHNKHGNLFVMSMPFEWMTQEGVSRTYYFHMAKSQLEYRQQVAHFREKLTLWLGGLLAVLLVLHYLLLEWGFMPLGVIASELRSIEQGKRDHLRADVPTELMPLTRNLNQLIEHERTQQQAYQNALGDLAHSLKTPLAVIASSMVTAKSLDELKPLLHEQIKRLDSLVSYQLKRAVSRTKKSFNKPILIKGIVDKLLEAMQKVYAHKTMTLSIDIHPKEVTFNASEADLFELFGNLIENAFKYGETQLIVTVRLKTYASKPGIHIVIANDGECINTEKAPEMLQRGTRGNVDEPGHGIGLAIVNDLVISYGGELELGPSSLGGTRIAIWLPN